MDEAGWDTVLASGTWTQKQSLLQELAEIAVSSGEDSKGRAAFEASFSRILGVLRGSDAILQAEVCSHLVPLGLRGAEAFPSLMRLIYSKDYDLQERAIAALGAVAPGNNRVLRALIGLFSAETSGAGLQSAIMLVFTAWGPVAAAASNLLIEIIADDHMVKEYAVGDVYYWWYEYEEPRHEEYMLQVRAAAALVAMEVEHPSIMEVLRRAYEAKRFYGHALVIHTWGRMGPRAMSALDLFIPDFPMAEPDLRGLIITTAFAIQAQLDEILPLMLEGLMGADDDELNAAKQALASLATRKEEAVMALRGCLPRHAGSHQLRGMAAFALGQLGADDPVTQAALGGLVNDAAPFVRKQAMRAMRELGVEDNELIAAYFRQIEDPKEAIRSNAARALLERDAHPEAAYRVLVEILQTQGQRLRKSWKRKYASGILDAIVALDETMDTLIAELESGPGATIPEALDLFLGLKESLVAALPPLDQLLRELAQDPLQRGNVLGLQESMRLLERAVGASDRFAHWQEDLEEALF